MWRRLVWRGPRRAWRRARPQASCLSAQYRGFFDAAHNPEALRIALTGVSTNHLSVADFGRVSADNEAFTGWVAKMKDRFKSRPAPTGPTKAVAPAKPAPPPAKQAQAATGTAKG